ncbi:MAG: S41 family peptidase [Psychroflexus halocasei]
MKKKIILSSLTLVVIGSLAFKSVKNDFFEIAKQIEIFTNLYKEINMNYVDEVSPSELMNTAITAMLADLDPYTVYWNEQQVIEGRIRNQGDYAGIGAHIESYADKILIKSLEKNSPADKANLKIGDEIIKIDDINISEYSEDAGQLLQGETGSEVEITFTRNGQKQSTVLEREKHEKNAVIFHQLLEDKSGYIVLDQFTKTASAEVIKAFKELKREGATQIILDLRNNPGGLLSEAINITNIFVDKGTTIVTTKSVIEKYNKTYVTQNKALDTEIPLVVLINHKSASASEIVSGSLQDLDRAVVIGGRSFGKGLVQRPKKLNYGTQAKITISRYYTPSGRSIQALDYVDGVAVRKSEDSYQKFKTRNGREVFSGGGILPDILIESESTNALTEELEKNNLIFGFTNQYFSKNDELDISEMNNDKLFDNFKSFVDKNDFSFESETEKELQKLKDIAEKENIYQKVNKDFEALKNQINKAEETLFEQSQPQLELSLTKEIIKRYTYEEGVFEYLINNGESISKAKEILNNQKAYQKILE